MCVLDKKSLVYSRNMLVVINLVLLYKQLKQLMLGIPNNMNVKEKLKYTF